MELPQRLARRQEARAARDYGGRIVPASGSLTRKGDVETPDELIECKHTEKRSYSLKMTELRTAILNAAISSKRMVFEVEFTDHDGSNPSQFVVLDKNDYLAMREELEDWRAERAM